MNNIILFPGMEQEKEQLKEKEDLSMNSVGIQQAVNSDSGVVIHEYIRENNSSKDTMSKSLNKKKNNRRGALSKVVRNIILTKLIIQKALKVKLVKRTILSVTAVITLGVITPKVMKFYAMDNVTMTSPLVEEDSMSFVESLNSELDAQFQQGINGTSSVTNNEITEDVVITLPLGLKGNEIPTYKVEVKATLLSKDIQKDKYGVPSYDVKDIEYTLMSILPDLSEEELKLMGSKSLDKVYKEMETLRKKAIKNLAKDEHIINIVSEAINNLLSE